MERILNQLKNPFAGLNQLLERANLTGIDTAGIVEARRKDIDAILEANRIVYQGAQALAQKQLEILRTTMNAARGAVAEGSFTGSPLEIANRQREFLSRAFQMSLAHMRELADIVKNSQSEAFAVVRGQVDSDIRNLVAKVRGSAAGRAHAAPKVRAARTAKRKAGAKRAVKRTAKGAATAAPKPAAKRKAKGKAGASKR
jgi:phasin family protein